MTTPAGWRALRMTEDGAHDADTLGHAADRLRHRQQQQHSTTTTTFVYIHAWQRRLSFALSACARRAGTCTPRPARPSPERPPVSYGSGAGRRGGPRGSRAAAAPHLGDRHLAHACGQPRLPLARGLHPRRRPRGDVSVLAIARAAYSPRGTFRSSRPRPPSLFGVSLEDASQIWPHLISRRVMRRPLAIARAAHSLGGSSHDHILIVLRGRNWGGPT